MNIKDRLKKINQDTKIIIEPKIIKKQNNISFDNDVVKDILFEYINKFYNIIFITDKSVDNKLISEYFENYIENIPKITVLDKEANDINIENNTVNLLPEISGKSLIYILEQILYGTKSFIIGLHLNSYENVLEKLKTIIALNSNLTENCINTILAETNALILNIKYDNNNKLSVFNIDKIQLNNQKLSLKNLYIYSDEKTIPPNTSSIETKNNQSDLIFNTIVSSIQDKSQNSNIPIEKNNNSPQNTTIQTQINNQPQQNKKNDNDNLNNENQNILPALTKQNEIILSKTNILEQNNSEDEDKTKNTEDKTSLPSNQNNNNTTKECDLNTQKNILPEKINKYKLLKEKIKNKKDS